MCRNPGSRSASASERQLSPSPVIRSVSSCPDRDRGSRIANPMRHDTDRPVHPATPILLAAHGLLGSLAACAPSPEAPSTADPAIVQTALHDFRVEEVADGLVRPFAMAFTPDGDLLVTERPGRLRIIRNGELLPDSVDGLPEIRALGRGARSMDGFEQAGLRDVVLHPDFATNRLLYLSYTRPGPDSLGNIAIARGRFADDRVTEVEELFHADAPGNGTDRSSMWGGTTRVRRRRLPLHDAGGPAVAFRGRPDGASRAGSRESQRDHDPDSRRRPDPRRQPVRGRGGVRAPRSGPTATATPRGWPSTPRPATCGRTSTARRAETSST